MNTDKIARYVWKGKHDIDWYLQAERMFVDLFGEHRLQLVTKLFAATSINTSLKANITLFRRALHEIDNDLPISNYLPNIKQQLQQIRAGKDLTGRKIRSFAAGMSGDLDAVVVDVWLLRAFDMDKKYFRNDKIQPTKDSPSSQMSIETSGYSFDSWLTPKGEPITNAGRFRSGGASDSQYTKIENYVRQEARAMGIQPRQLSAMIWSGVRIDQSGDANTRYVELLQNKMYNMFNEIVAA